MVVIVMLDPFRMVLLDPLAFIGDPPVTIVPLMFFVVSTHAGRVTVSGAVGGMRRRRRRGAPNPIGMMLLDPRESVLEPPVTIVPLMFLIVIAVSPVSAVSAIGTPVTASMSHLMSLSCDIWVVFEELVEAWVGVQPARVAHKARVTSHFRVIRKKLLEIGLSFGVRCLCEHWRGEHRADRYGGEEAGDCP